MTLLSDLLRRHRRFAALIAAAVVDASVIAQQPTFRSDTRLVVETVSVTGRDGLTIEGLTAKDFVITEDGEPQTISFVDFQRLETGPRAAAAPSDSVPASTGSRTLASSTAGQITVPPAGDDRYRNRRLVVLYFDLTAMPPPDQIRAYRAALTFIDRDMQRPDVAAILTFGGGAVRVKQDFTDDRAVLREVVQTLMYGEDRDGDGIPDNIDVGTAFGQDDAEFNILNTDRQLSALQTAATLLRPIPEQKLLIYFASGLRLNGVDNQAQLRATTNAAIRANVVLNPIDARGLVAQAPLGDATRASPGGIGIFSGQTAQAAVSMFQRSQDTLYSLAKDTGGKAMFDYNDLALGIAQATQALSSYYVLGYYPTHTAKDGRFHRVRIALAGGLSAGLSYRQGYYADKEFAKFTAADKERQLEDALMSENPITDIALAMEVNYFQLNRAEYFVPVAVKIPGSELALARRGGAARTVIDFIGEVKDDYGITVQNVRDKLDIKLDENTAVQLSRRPIQYETGFTLLPGKYVLKVLARDAETGRIGTYEASFAIPNLNREEKRLPISSVVLGSQRVRVGAELYTVKNSTAPVANPLVSNGERLIPSVTRVFSTQAELHVFLQAYERGAEQTAPLVVFVSFYRGEVKAFETTPISVADGLDPRSKAVPLRVSVPLEKFPTGRYDCQVTVIEPGGGKVAFWRAPIAVVP